jgi:hypothetical protein
MTYEQRNWEGKKRAYGRHFTGIGMVYSGIKRDGLSFLMGIILMGMLWYGYMQLILEIQSIHKAKNAPNNSL